MARSRIAALSLGVALALSVGLGCGGTRPAGTGSTWQPVEKTAYQIGAGDVLQVRVWKNPELSVETPVRPDGKLSVPLVGELQAEGLSAEELETLLAHRLSEYISNPEVTVLVRVVQSKRAYVLGEVVRSGPIPLNSDMRVLDALSVAGGFTPFADKRDVKVIRQAEDGEVEFHFDYKAYVAGKAPGSNIRLLPGDTIVVPD